nr:hypothetical protein [Tanacetum cinerariifolium]
GRGHPRRVDRPAAHVVVAREQQPAGLGLHPDAGRQDSLLRHRRAGAGSGLGIRRPVLARLYDLPVVDRAAVVLGRHRTFPLGHVPGGVGAGLARAGVRLLRLWRQQRLHQFPQHPGVQNHLPRHPRRVVFTDRRVAGRQPVRGLASGP